MRLLIALFACGLWIPAALSDWSPPEDEDTSGDDLEISGSGSGDDGLPESHADVQKHLYITPFSTSLDPVPVSVTTEPNQSLRYEPEKAISSWAPLTIEAGSVITTDQATEALTDENHQHGQSTSDTSDATPTPADTQPRAGKGLHGMGRRPSLSSVTPITTMTVDVDATVVKQEPQGVPDSEKIHPAPSATPPSEAKVPNPTQGMPTSDSVASVSTLLTTVHDDSVVEEVIIPGVSMEVESEGDSDITLEEEPRLRLEDTANASSQNQSLLDRTEVLAGVIAGGVVGLAFAILLVSLMVYRMKKKDEGSYSLDEHKHPNVGYQKPQKQEEFLA